METNWNIDGAWTGAKALDKLSLARFYQQDEPTLSGTTIDWRIHELLRSERIVNVGRGRYELKSKANYLPVLNDRLKSISQLVKEAFPYLDFCIFHTEQLSSFMQHLPGRHLIVVEVERDAMEAVFLALRDRKVVAFLKPDMQTMSLYVSYETESVIVQPLISEAPCITVDGVATASLEKVLVDIACEKAIYTAYQGAEQRYIYQNAFASYHLRLDRMLRYAARRKRKHLILEILSRFGIEIS